MELNAIVKVKATGIVGRVIGRYGVLGITVGIKPLQLCKCVPSGDTIWVRASDTELMAKGVN